MLHTPSRLIQLLVALVCVTGCGFFGNQFLSVRTGKRVVYQTENGQLITATYYSLSDGSLSFVKVKLPDGRERTLPRVLSASGERYTDDSDLVWWTKGDRAFAETRGENGQWQVIYDNCRPVSR